MHIFIMWFWGACCSWHYSVWSYQNDGAPILALSKGLLWFPSSLSASLVQWCIWWHAATSSTCLISIAIITQSSKPNCENSALLYPCIVFPLFYLSFLFSSKNSITTGQNHKEGQRDHQAVSAGVPDGHSHTYGLTVLCSPSQQGFPWVGQAFFLKGHSDQISFKLFSIKCKVGYESNLLDSGRLRRPFEWLYTNTSWCGFFHSILCPYSDSLHNGLNSTAFPWAIKTIHVLFVSIINPEAAPS